VGKWGVDMPQVLQLWWALPALVGIATVALSSGLSGALFVGFFFLSIVGLQPVQAIGIECVIRRLTSGDCENARHPALDGIKTVIEIS